jgi:hypothetical protein
LDEISGSVGFLIEWGVCDWMMRFSGASDEVIIRVENGGDGGDVDLMFLLKLLILLILMLT